ncbi:MAG: hypothetical protein QNJ57_06495 [Flavobacteriaceae bacterium]|nr:hypothetical protein [Flavobacteriaceae bacterium]
MKKQKMKLSIIALALIGLVFTSCTDSEAVIDDTTSSEVDLKAVEEEAEVDKISDETSAIIEEAFLMEEFPATKSSAIDRYLPDCVTITVVIVQNMKTVTIDFGDGCELRNGNFVSGKIILEYEKDPGVSVMKSFEFDGFTFNDKSVEGSGSILRERSNENGNPQSTRTGDVTVTWPDGSFANKNGTKTREMIEGQGTPAWGDNVFLITGNWNFTKKDGTELSAEVLEPLRRELACKFLVSGIIDLNKNENNAVLNYGDGECDDLATVSINGGEEIEIHLSNLR